MGLGKTIMTIALILETKNRKTRPNNKLGTLIVLPKAVLNQWGKELE
jgi:SNF2 family DNA or RNA helicase